MDSIPLFSGVPADSSIGRIDKDTNPVLTLTVEDLFNEFVERKKSEWSGATYLKWNDTTRQHVLPG